MDKQEKIILGIAFAAAVGIVVFQTRRAEAPTMAEPTQTAVPESSPRGQNGPAYLTYNTPWAFAPPVANFMPTMTSGQVGQTVQSPT